MAELKENVAQVVDQAESNSESILDQAIQATKQTEPDKVSSMLKALTEEVMSGTVTWGKNITDTLKRAIASIDQTMSTQLAEIMHKKEFLSLEGSWRGLEYLVKNSETSTSLKIRVLNATKKQVYKDLEKAVEFDQSQLFKKIYEAEFGSPGGEPYGALIGDYEFSAHPEDVDMLRQMSGISAASFCPFISTPAPELFGFESWSELSKPRDLEKIFDSAEYTQWRAFRETEDSRFVNLVMPRVLSRLPYGESTKAIEEFAYEESAVDSAGRSEKMPHDHYAWMSTAYVMGARLTNAFSKYGWCTSIRGAEGGGKVDNLPTHVFMSDSGDYDSQCPTEIAITDRREAELGKLGFLPLSHYKNTDYAVFFGGQTTQIPKKYDNPDATANAAISARLPYMMATSRFAHYLKMMARDKVGSFMEASDCEAWLNRWILNYVNGSEDASAEMKAKFPLAEAKITVKEIPGQPGAYNAIAWLRPWLQMEELTTSMRMVAKIPEMK